MCGDDVSRTNAGIILLELPDGRTVTRPCPKCAAGKQFQAAEAERMADLYKASGVMGMNKDASLDHFKGDPSIVRDVAGLVENGEFEINGKSWNGFYIWGPTGTGKTHLASAAVNYAYRIGKPALFYRVGDLLNALRNTYNQKSDLTFDALQKRIINAPLLVLDDYGTQRDTEWAQEQMYLIIDARVVVQASTIVTSNLSFADLDAKCGDDWTQKRILSRLVGMCAPLKMGGIDRRKGK